MPKLFTSIHDLPFHRFRDIMLEGDLKLLCSECEATEQELKEVWQDLMEQYSEAIGEGDRDEYLSTRRELLYYEAQRLLVDTLVSVLKDFYVEKWAVLLGKIVQMTIRYTDEESLYKQLHKALQRSRGIIDINMEILRVKLEDIEEKKVRQGGDNDKPTREFFTRVLLNLHEYSAWQFDDEKISTFQYCELVKRYNQHIQYMETLKAKHK